MPAPHRQSPSNAESGPSSTPNPPRAVSPQARQTEVENDISVAQHRAAATQQGAQQSLGLGAGRPLPPPPPRSASPPALNAEEGHGEVRLDYAAGRNADMDRDRDVRREVFGERGSRDPFASQEGGLGDPIQVPEAHAQIHTQTQRNDPGPRGTAPGPTPSTESDHPDYRHRLIDIAGDLLDETLIQPDDVEGVAGASSAHRGTGSPGLEDEGLGARLVHLAADYAGHNMHRIRLPQVLTPRVRTGATPGSPNPDNGRDYFGQAHGFTSRRRDQSQPTSPILRTPGETAALRTPRLAVSTPGGRSSSAHTSAARNAELPPLPPPPQQPLHESPTHTNERDSTSTDPIGPLVTADNHINLLADPPSTLNRRGATTDNNTNRENTARPNISLHLPPMAARATTWDRGNGNGNNYVDQGNGNAGHGNTHANTPRPGLSRQRTLETRMSVGAPSIMDHAVPVQIEMLDEKVLLLHTSSNK
jgi:hypothetical protein